MTSTTPNNGTGDEVSLLRIVNAAFRHPRLLVFGLVVGALLTTALAIRARVTYTATASFVPQSADRGRSGGLANLAGQLGVSLATDQAQSPDFYADLLASRELLTPIATDTISVAELRNSVVKFGDLIGVKPGPSAVMRDQAIAALSKMLGTSVTKMTGVVHLNVTTQWPSVSTLVADRLIRGVNEFNLRTRQSQARAERRFVESRLALARDTLRAAEERLGSFLRTNRQIGNSPDLTFQRDRLQREVGMHEQIVTSLVQNYEDARIREVRDTPVITVIEPPVLPALPDRRPLFLWVAVGLSVGAVLGFSLALVSEVIHAPTSARSPELEELLARTSAGRARLRRALGRRTQPQG